MAFPRGQARGAAIRATDTLEARHQSQDCEGCYCNTAIELRYMPPGWGVTWVTPFNVLDLRPVLPWPRGPFVHRGLRSAIERFVAGHLERLQGSMIFDDPACLRCRACGAPFVQRGRSRATDQIRRVEARQGQHGALWLAAFQPRGGAVRGCTSPEGWHTSPIGHQAADLNGLAEAVT
jgi:hypothetical protein